MSIAFKHYDSISYSENCSGVCKLNKKKEQATKILEVAKHTSYTKKVKERQFNKFILKIFLYYFSGVFSSIIQNIFDHCFDMFMAKHGIKKIPIEIKIEE